MIINLKEVRDILGKQDYLSYEKILTSIYDSIDSGDSVVIEGSSTVLRSRVDVEDFNRKMVQVHGIYGLV